MAKLYMNIAVGTFLFSSSSEYWAYSYSDKRNNNNEIANHGMVVYNIFATSCKRGLTWPVAIPQLYTGSYQMPIYKRTAYAFNVGYKNTPIKPTKE